MKPRLLDLYCKQGGAAAGYAAAGFEVVGVDSEPQPNYPFMFIRADALLYGWGAGRNFAAIHASPPCQAHSNTQKIQGNTHIDLITPTRLLLQRLGRPYVIENVPGAPLINPAVLCGASFGLHTYRHRLFESSFPIPEPPHRDHDAPTVKMGRRLRDGDFYHAVGNFSNVDYVRRDMGVEWMTREGIRECIPPAYTEFIGGLLMAEVLGVAA